MACTSAVDDIIDRYFRRAVSRLILHVETLRLDGSYYFWLFFEIQASKHDSVTSATDPLQLKHFNITISNMTKINKHFQKVRAHRTMASVCSPLRNKNGAEISKKKKKTQWVSCAGQRIVF